MSAQKLVGENALSALASDIKSAVALKANSADVYPKTDTYTKQETDDEINEALTNVLPKATSSGSIANFSTSLALPLVAMSAEIVAQQASGTPTPSNPLPISGVSSVSFYQRGVNLWDEQTESGTYNWTTGEDYPNTDFFRTANYIKVLPSTNYTLVNPTKSTTYLRVAYYDKNGVFISATGYLNGTTTITTPNTCNYIKFAVAKTVYGSTYANDISLNSSSDTEYHAYTGNTFTIALGQTVYGGVLDAKNGKLIVTHKYILLDGSETWSMPATGYFALALDNLVNDNSRATIISDRFLGDSWTRISGLSIDNAVGVVNGTTVRFHYSELSDVASWKSWLANNNTQICYELQTPIEITGLTPANFTTIAGENNIFSDCGDISVTYCHEADATDYMELSNKPTINGVTLTGNKTTADLGLWLDLSGTLTAGTTEITFISEAITANSFIQVFTPDGTDYTSISVSTGEIVLTFDAQAADLPIKVRIS